MDYAIFMLDTDGVVTSWNAGAERIKGYKRDEIIGKHLSRFFLPRTSRPASRGRSSLRRAATAAPNRGLARAQERRALLGARC